jgi:hypothetical protein
MLPRGFLLTFLSVCLGISAANAQNSTAGRQPYDGADSTSGPLPIHVDQNCRILPRPGNPLSKKARPYHDDAMCSIESPSESTHWEEKISGNQLDRWFVHIKEEELTFQDVADQPVMYIVEYAVPKGWFVDSDPQPWQMAGQTAYFHVYVNPGETIRLHVGIRREWAQKPKPI